MPHPGFSQRGGGPHESRDSGSVRRARENVGAGLTYFPYESGDQSPVPSISSPLGVSRTLSQTSGQWPHEGQKNTAQDILHHPLMTQAPPPPRPNASGELLQDFKFPGIPPPAPNANPKRNRDPAPPTSRRPGPSYYTPTAHVSPIVEEAPDSLRSRSVYSHASSGVLAPVRSTSRLNLRDQYDEASTAASSPLTPHRPAQREAQPLVRQASLGKKAKPAITTIKPWGVDQQHFKSNQIRGQGQVQAQDRSDKRRSTMDALSAAVAAGMATNPSQVPMNHSHDVPDIRPTPSRTNTGGLRMPFGDASPPLSPISAHTVELEPPRLFTPTATSRSHSPQLTPTSAHSQTQLQPPLPGMSGKIPSDRRPPKLDMDAVRENERSSTTSLADLIRRATKLAANLDRGKTASRLGMLDMFYGDNAPNRRRGDPNNRASGISDMLSAFPAAGGTPSNRSRDQLGVEKWPDEGVKMQRLPSRDGKEPRTKRRRCCGMSVPCFLVVMLILVILIAAAVLVPLFLIVLPKQHQNAASSTTVNSCKESYKCLNGGVSIVANGNCACVCVSGFTGTRCKTDPSQDCITARVPGVDVDHATMGAQISRLLQDSQSNYSIPLDSGTVLGLFERGGTTCLAEDNIVAFNFNPSRRKDRRFYPIKLMEEQLKAAPTPMVTAMPQMDNIQIARRDESTATAKTSNGIVFQETSTTEAGVVTTATAASTNAAASASVTSSSSPTSIGSDNPSIPQRKLDFARIAVLYVFEQSASLSYAVNAQQILRNELLSGATNIVEIGYGSLDLRADLGAYKILWGNGTVIGG